MHREAFRWVELLLKAQPDMLLPGVTDVCELGSFNVNGTIRPLFKDAHTYTGIDLRDGDGVDIVADALDYGSNHAYDLVVSCEMLEHAHFPKGVIRNMHRILRPGGYLILTCASQDRAPHGNDGLEPGDEHYQGISVADLEGWLSSRFTDFAVEENTASKDIYAWARR